MVVRGAPAIAIATALSLAVEVSNLASFDGNSDDASIFLCKKLDYLVSSRPIAVNLSDAAVKLKEVIKKAAATVKRSQFSFSGSNNCLALTNTQLSCLNINNFSSNGVRLAWKRCATVFGIVSP
ncbi:hypothetical protein K7X08_027793 [Anisodus acutangulus]|uniref:Uncharacterized protein n=1 Tax=Anisodus acutangulus TaxID=402998 RepID=A0A9Q1R3R8_9SOLA|nr:hypothetical protein K7X08_027793 [Anisodus acutangulus]